MEQTVGSRNRVRQSTYELHHFDREKICSQRGDEKRSLEFRCTRPYRDVWCNQYEL